MTSADVRAAGIDKLAINLVAEQVKVVLLDQVAYLIHFATGVEVARRVVRITDKDGTRLFVDELLELLDFRQGEALLDGSRDGSDDGTSRDGKRHVVCVRRLRHDYLVARVQTSQEGEQHRLATTAGDDDIIRREVDVVLAVVADQLLAIAEITLTGTVLEDGAVDVLYGINRRLGCGKVGLTDVQVVNMYSSVFCGVCQGSQLANRRLRHLNTSYGNLWHLSITVKTFTI